MRASDDPHFDASGPVGRYWLTNGVGFTVRDLEGRTLGDVAHVVVDRRRQDAERLIVRRPGLVRRPRYVAIHPRAVESVLPESRLFLVPPAETRTVPASRRTGGRVRGVAVSVRAASVALGRALGPVVAALDRRVAAAAEAIVRGSRRGASAAAAAAARADRRLGREAPKVAASLAASTREAGRLTLAALRFADRSARSFVRVLGDLAVLAAVGVVALWRRGEAALAQQRSTRSEQPSERRDVDAPEWRRDADSPLARERQDVRSDRRARR